MTTRTETVRTNKRGEVAVPFFKVGAPEPDLAGIILAVSKATRKDV
jgi:hypothetical protein